MVPRDLARAAEVTSSERRVHTALAGVAIEGVALHSFNLPEHERKMTAELDFVLVTDRLVLCVEVKGAGVAQRGGEWTYSDSRGHVRTSREGPFAQVSSAMYALRDRLGQLLGNQDSAKLAFGFLVVTPDVDLPQSVEWARDTYLGHRQFTEPGGLEEAITRASTYWLNKQRWAEPIATPLRRKILGVLRPEFDKVPGLIARTSILDSVFNRLSEEQMSHLDIIADNDRVLCQGGAGTAKTFMAVEVARRAAARGERTLLVCRSAVLASYLRGRLASVDVHIAAISELNEKVVYDRLVVDEGQDLMTVDSLAVLDGVLPGGLENGRWTFFFDPNRQALYGAYEADALTLLRSYAVPATLRTNCRNTREIVFNTRALTGADIGVAAAGSGPKVEIIGVADKADESQKLDAWVRTLVDDYVPPGDITIVSVHGSWEKSAARATKFARTGRLERLTTASAVTWPPRRLSWASVVDVKGLENRFVAVVDIDGLDNNLDIDRLYVAMSRPRAGLWLAVPESARARLEQLWTSNMAQASQVLGDGGS